MSDVERAEECAKRMFAEYPDILKLIKHENMYHMVEFFITRAWMEGHKYKDDDCKKKKDGEK